MLASITPLGERGRRSTWGVTVTAFALGAIAAALFTGALLGLLGAAAGLGGASTRARVAILAGAVAAAVAIDASSYRVPGPRRQVDERWLDRYRGWVYGLGYGSQLGLAVTTVVSSAATYVALVAALLSASALDGAIILGCFGAVRGLTPLAAAHVRSQRQLLDLHRGLDQWRTRVQWGTVGLQVAILVVAVSVAGS
jgi:MFS family permease